MHRMFSAVPVLMAILVGCSSAVPTITPIAVLQTPTASLTSDARPVLMVSSADELLLKPNEAYSVQVTFANSPPARVTVYEPYPSDRNYNFDLQVQDSVPDYLTTKASEQTGAGWGLPFILYAVNMQPGRNIPASRSIEGTLLLSPNRHTLAFFLCNEHGGRGQWCYESRLWLFDLTTGEAQHIDLVTLSAVSVKNLCFSDDSQTISGETCLQYANAYFGYCGRSIVMMWEAATGNLIKESP